MSEIVAKRKYNHSEAFCLMKYRTDDGTETETLWNSRDGVTPFMITSLSGKTMQHVDWRGDKCVPDFKPPAGMRVFVDATLELITPKLNEYVDKIWDDPNWPASKNWGTKQECFEALAPSWLHNGEAPWIVVASDVTLPASRAEDFAQYIREYGWTNVAVAAQGQKDQTEKWELEPESEVVRLRKQVGALLSGIWPEDGFDTVEDVQECIESLRVGGSPARSVEALELLCGNCITGECITGDHDCNRIACQCPQVWCVATRKELTALPGSLPSPAPQPELSKHEARQLAAGLIDYAEGRIKSIDEIEKEMEGIQTKCQDVEVEEDAASGPSLPSEETRATAKEFLRDMFSENELIDSKGLLDWDRIAEAMEAYRK